MDGGILNIRYQLLNLIHSMEHAMLDAERLELDDRQWLNDAVLALSDAWNAHQSNEGEPAHSGAVFAQGVRRFVNEQCATEQQRLELEEMMNAVRQRE